MKSRRRRAYPIAIRSHQYRFLALILGYNMVVVFFLGLFLFVPDIMQLQDQGLSLEIRAAAADKLLNMHARVWPVLLTLICLIGMHSFRVFHRFVGPLYRFQKAFEQVEEGDLSLRVKLREKDFLHEEERILNGMIGRIDERIGAAKEAGLRALDSLNELGKIPGDADRPLPSREELLTGHRRDLNDLMEAIGYFRLSRDEKGNEKEMQPG